MTSDEEFKLLGSRAPRIRAVPDYVGSLGEPAIDLCATAGLILDGWQQDTFIDWLGVRPDGRWAARTAACVCPRQNGKTWLLAARELTGIFLLDEGTIVHSSHEQATASDQFRLVEGLIDSSPLLKKRAKKAIHGKGSEAIEFRSGQRILFKTRTSGGLRGFRVDCLIFDEAYNLPDVALAAMLPTQTAAANPQAIWASSAVDQQMHEHGVNLARVRRRAIAGDSPIAYSEWSIDGDPDRIPKDVLSDPRTWAQANPGLGLHQQVETLANIFATMGPRQFAVEHCGAGDWPSDDPDADRIITVVAWEALLDEGSRMATRDGVIAFDVSPDLTFGSIAGAGYRDDGRVHVGIIDHQPRSSWMAGAVADLYHTLHPSLVICDGRSTAMSIVPDLDRMNIPVKITTASEYAQACSMFAEGVAHQTISHREETPLTIAIDGAATRPLSDAWAWDKRKSSVSDISPLVAATLAHWGVAGQVVKKPEVYDLRETMERLMREAETPSQPEPSGGQRFIPLTEMPTRGW